MPATSTSTRGRVRARPSTAQTRARVLQAVIDSVAEKGYYQTSSNEIARRAGVTWGTIQHQFGTREGLLLAVVEDRWQELQRSLATATVHGDTLEERLTSVLDVLALHYGAASHLAHVQIALDLTHDPAVSADVRKAVRRQSIELERAWRPLFAQALGEAAADEELITYAFLTLRGFMTAQLISTAVNAGATRKSQTELLVRGVACVIRDRARAQRLAVD